MLELNDVCIRKGDQDILKGLNISIKKGEVVGIIGSNGAGKTTLLKTVAGLIKPNSGEIKLFDLPFSNENSSRIKRSIGYLSDSSFLYEQMSPIENLIFFGKLYQINNVEEKAQSLIDAVGLSFFKYDAINTFSRGMLQRLAIAKALINNPKLVLLDEPYTNLDQNGIKTLNSFIYSIKLNNSSVLLVTHDFEQAIALCDRFILLNKGKVLDVYNNEGKNIDILKERYQNKVDKL